MLNLYTYGSYSKLWHGVIKKWISQEMSQLNYVTHADDIDQIFYYAGKRAGADYMFLLSDSQETGSRLLLDIAIDLKVAFKNSQFIVLSHNSDVLQKMVNENLNLSGFLKIPVEKEALFRLFKNTYTWYQGIKADDGINIYANGYYHNIDFQDILYFKVRDHYIDAETFDGKFTFYDTPDNLMKKLNKNFEYEGNYIVNRENVKVSGSPEDKEVD